MIRERLKPAAPVLIAGAIGIFYILVSPRSFDLAAHLTRAKLFDAAGFSIWDNWWYSGHFTPSYSVLFPPLAAAVTPQVVGALSCAATAAVAAPIARDRFGPEAWVGAAWFGLATTLDLFTGRLAFAFGLLPATAGLLALTRNRPLPATLLGALSALASPVAALFLALAGVAHAAGELVQRGAGRGTGTSAVRSALPGLTVATGSLLPVALLAVAFPEGGSEPFALATLLPIPAIALVAFVALPKPAPALRAAIVLYVIGCIAAYAVPTPVGSNAARLAPLLAGPLAAAAWWRRRTLLLALVAVPLMYLQWQAPVRDVTKSDDDPAVGASYYRPLLGFLAAQLGPPFRIEIPFTYFHWEAYQVAPRFPLARGWERQLDLHDNKLFYGAPLTAATYEAWLHSRAVRFVALADTRLDWSSTHEAALIGHGLSYLRLVFRSRHWRVFAVSDPTPIVAGAASLAKLGPSSLTLTVHRPGRAEVRVHWSPYWALPPAAGCVAPDGDFVRLTLRRAGTIKLVQRFAIGRIGARSPRCS